MSAVSLRIGKFAACAGVSDYLNVESNQILFKVYLSIAVDRQVQDFFTY